VTLVDRIAAYRARIEQRLRERFGGTWVEEWALGLYHGMLSHPAYEKIEMEAEDVEDSFMIACFPDAFGVPSPVSYYTAELLPYLQEEFAAWERRMWGRQSIFESKGRHHHHF